MASPTSCAEQAVSGGRCPPYLTWVWLLLPEVPDWRWGLEGETTPWYPSLRLFRQTRRGDWAGVMARIRETLEQWIS